MQFLFAVAMYSYLLENGSLLATLERGRSLIVSGDAPI